MLLRRKQEKEFPKCRESLWSPQVVTQTPSQRQYYHAQGYPVNDEDFKSVAAKEPDQDRDDEVADCGRYNRADEEGEAHFRRKPLLENVESFLQCRARNNGRGKEKRETRRRFPAHPPEKPRSHRNPGTGNAWDHQIGRASCRERV